MGSHCVSFGQASNSLILKVRLAVLLAMPVALLLCGCQEYSIVVKAKKDKSATVHLRHFSANNLTFGDDAKSKTEIPTEAQAQEIANKFGEGVTVKGISAATSSNGINGYEIVFECKDINKLQIDLNTLWGENERPKDQPPLPSQTFSHDGNSLVVHQTLPENKQKKSNLKGSVFGQTVNPFGESTLGHTGTSNAMQIAPDSDIAKVMVAKTKIAIVIQVDDEIESCDALHQKEGVITMAKLDGSKFDIGKMDQLQSSFELYNVGHLKGCQELIDTLEGFDVDLQPKVTIKFK